jgi:hypothetical protein
MLVISIILFLIALVLFIFWISALYLVLKIAFWVLVACGVFLLLMLLFAFLRSLIGLF